jgi:hypothetical protein
MEHTLLQRLRHGLEGVESTLGIVVCRIVGIIVDNRFQVGQTPGFQSNNVSVLVPYCRSL